jgi:hypothetical protein
VLAAIPFRRFGQPEGIGSAVRLLTSEELGVVRDGFLRPNRAAGETRVARVMQSLTELALSDLLPNQSEMT